jgi:uncharacterized protein
MQRWTSLAVMMLVLAGVLVAGHYYLWTRLVRDTGVGFPTRQVMLGMLGALAVGFPAAIIIARLVPPARSTWWITPVYLWIGVSTLLVLSVAAVDLLRAGYLLAAFGREGIDPDRRRALARLAAAVALTIGFGASGWAALEGRRVRVKHIEVPLKKLPKALDGLSIVQLTDIHIGPVIGRGFVERVVAIVNDLAPDIVAITGDLVDATVEELVGEVAPLARLTSRFGTFFVTGNHEYFVDAPRWCQHLGQLGVRVLRNEHVQIERDGEILHLAGIDDYESERIQVGHRMDLPRAVAGRDSNCPLVLLAHQPKAVHEAVRHGVDLQLSGHTHGGQIWPLGWLQRLGQPAVAGLAKFGETFLYVSCGTGSSGPPMRLAAPAEITHVTLRAVS